MGIVNGPAPEGRATGATDWMTTSTMERDSLQVQLQESERLRKEAFASCETMREQVAAVTLERDEWKGGAEHAMQQATKLRLQVAALESSLKAERERVKGLSETAQVNFTIGEHNHEVAEQLRSQLVNLQAQLDAAAVTPAQQSDNAAERLDRVRRMIGEVCGWYACVDWMDEVERTDSWEHAGALLGRLQREAG